MSTEQQEPEPEPLPESPSKPAHLRRALTLIAVSLLAISATGVAYLHPSLPGSASGAGRATSPISQAGYQLAAVDFVSPASGWVVATFDSGDFTVLHTSDAGDHWARQLSGPTHGHGAYVHFFDASRGLLALIGARPLIYWTTDGGESWRPQVALNAAANVLSLSFVDPEHGWLLIQESKPTPGPAKLYRTVDGGGSWSNLGEPTLPSDQPYRVQFADRNSGWLDSLSPSPYAYKTLDAGVTWRRLPLSRPQGEWPASGQFFVAAQPTQGVGVVVTVVNFPSIVGRSGIGELVLGYPPLTVRAYDGGLNITHSYAIFADAIPGSDLTSASRRIASGMWGPLDAPNQVQLGSMDGGATWSAIAPPTDPGSIGYSDSQNWWWIGSGAWSTSSDGGTTWSPYRNLGVPPPLPGSLQVLDRSHAWFAAMAGPRPVLEATNDGGVHWRMVMLPSMTLFGATNPG